MGLPNLGSGGKRSKAITLRVTDETAKKLKKLARDHALSQADVITFLIEQEFKRAYPKK